MPPAGHDSQPTNLRVADLNERRPTRFDIVPDPKTLDQLQSELQLLSLKKVRFCGEINAVGKKEWSLDAMLGATAQQACVVTLAPVTTRIDTAVIRRFVPQDKIDSEADGEDEEIEMNSDDTLEPLEDTIDLMRILAESLALALPDYPRSTDAALETTNFAAAGVKPMSDDDAKPFASLAELKAKMEKDG